MKLKWNEKWGKNNMRENIWGRGLNLKKSICDRVCVIMNFLNLFGI
jgi:hypothetical protein